MISRMILIGLGVCLSLLASQANAVNIPAVTTLSPAETVLCADGLRYTRCPIPAAVPLASWKDTTTPLNPTGTGIRVDITTDAEMSNFDPGTLTPGSVVNIFYKATPYRYKLAFFVDGTREHPIKVHGVTSPSGQQPVIDCDGATTVHPEDWSSQYGMPYGCWTLSHTRTQPYEPGVNDGPSWMYFRHLEMRGAKSTATFDDNRPYIAGVPPIRVANADHIFFENNSFIDNDNGIFVASNYPNKHIEIRGNRFLENGLVGSYLEHNVYLQAVAEGDDYNIVEGNYMGPLRAGALGLSGVKNRGTKFIGRYNTVICRERCFDIVEAQDALPDWIWTNLTTQEIIEQYRTAYVYGNVFIMDIDRGWYSIGGAVHCGMDTGSAHTNPQMFSEAGGGAAVGNPMARCYQGPLYFYHNSIYFNSGTTIARQALLDLDAGGGTGESTFPGTAIIANNVWQGRATSGAYLTYARYSGTYDFRAANLINAYTFIGNQIFEEYDLDMADANTVPLNATPPALVTTWSPTGTINFADPTNAEPTLIDLSLAPGSPARNAALPLPGAVALFPVQLQPSLGGGAVLRNSTNHLGAIE